MFTIIFCAGKESSLYSKGQNITNQIFSVVAIKVSNKKINYN